MTLLADLVAKLDADCPALITSSQAWSMAPIDDMSTEAPAAFTFPMEESAGPNRQDNNVAQSLTTDWAIFVVCLLSELETVRGEIRDSMLGWQPTNLYDSTVFVSGQAEDIKGTYIWWRDVYRTSTHIRKA